MIDLTLLLILPVSKTSNSILRQILPFLVQSLFQFDYRWFELCPNEIQNSVLVMSTLRQNTGWGRKVGLHKMATRGINTKILPGFHSSQCWQDFDETSQE
jgi:hypothetical protein